MTRENQNRHRVISVVALGGALAGLAYLFMLWALAWVCLIPLFYVLERQPAKGAGLCGALYGAITASILYCWVIPVASRYAGGFTYHSLLVFAGLVAYFSIYGAVFGLGYYLLRRRSDIRLLAGVSTAALYVLLEVLRTKLFPGSPWCHYTLACTQAQHSAVIQWAAVGGHSTITFAIVFCSYMATQVLFTRNAVLAAVTAVVIASFFGGGHLQKVVHHRIIDGRINVVFLNDNTPAAMRWDNRTGDSLARVLFALNREAANHHPDLIVWSETAIPWTIEPDDEFLPAVLGITRGAGTDHLVGAWSASPRGTGLVHNSAFLIRNDGTMTDRHDKTILLDFLETPITGGGLSVLPFLSASRYNNIDPGGAQSVITAGGAHIGVLICNESLSEEVYATYAGAKANVFIVMSNNAWFEETPVRMHHFYITRIAAVMMGRDVLVNSNRGIVGVIRGDGEVEALPPSPVARVVSCVALLSSSTTPYARGRSCTPLVFVTLMCVSLLVRRKHHETPIDGNCMSGNTCRPRLLTGQRGNGEMEVEK